MIEREGGSGVIDSSRLHDRMVFLVGVMRSGTNWLQRMLTAGPEVFGLPTETMLFEWVSDFHGHFQHANVGSFTVGQPYIDRDAFRDQMRAYCDAVLLSYAPDPLPPRLLERSPQHVNHLDLIGQLYPDAYVVHIIRDGRDVARSLLNMHFGPSTLPEAATEWKTSILGARRHAPGLARYVEVRYEDLLADPATQMPKLSTSERSWKRAGATSTWTGRPQPSGRTNGGRAFPAPISKPSTRSPGTFSVASATTTQRPSRRRRSRKAAARNRRRPGPRRGRGAGACWAAVVNPPTEGGKIP